MKRWMTMTMAAVLGAMMLWPALADDQPAPTDADEISELEKLIEAGDKQAESDEDKPADAAEPADEEPEAADLDAEQPDDEPTDLVDALLRRAGGQGGKPVMTRVIENMTRSRRQLREKYDPGKVTQRIQAQIIKDLEEAIELAQQASSSSSSSSSSQGQSKQKGRRQGQRPGQQQQPGGGQPQTNRGNQAARDEVGSHGRVQDGARGNDIEEGRKEWGNLPQRDRDEVVQGQDERGLSRWKAMIERYYTALQVQSEADSNR
jgi:hypothetical protein